MFIFAKVVFLLCAICLLYYLRLAWRQRILSKVLVILSAEYYFLYYVFFDIYPVAYKQYVWAGVLHLGAVTFRPGMKPDFSWISPLLFLLSFVAFYRESRQRKSSTRRQ